MTHFDTLTWRAAVAGRWAARIFGTLLVLFLLAFVFGEGPPSLARMTTQERLYGLGLCALYLGLAVAWFREGWGGLLSVLGWVFLAAIARHAPLELPFSIPAGIGLFHLLCWWKLRYPGPPAMPVNPKMAIRGAVIAGVPFALFLLLCANEIFGDPPLMAGSAPPPATVVGNWSGSLSGGLAVAIVVADDGSVSGSVAGSPLIEGKFVRNRSWFGRLMHWRTAYLLRGRLAIPVDAGARAAGDRFSAPVNVEAGRLNGSLFLFHPGLAKPLRLFLTRQ
jgi:hypothetical protein